MATLHLPSGGGYMTTVPLRSSAAAQVASAREMAIAQHVPSAVAYDAVTTVARQAPLEEKALRAGPDQLPDGRLFWEGLTRVVPLRLPLDYLRTRRDEGTSAFKYAVLDWIRRMKEEQYRSCLQDSTDWEPRPRAKHDDVIVFHTEFVVLTGSIEQLALNGRESPVPCVFGALSEEDREFLASFFNMRSLKLLYCGLTTCANIPRFPFLRELDLTGNQITDFKGLLCFKHLKALKLQENKLTTLKYFPVLPSLEELDLSWNPFQASLARLVERAGKLKVLRLRMTGVANPEHLLPLVQMPNLEVIDLGQTPIVSDPSSLERLAPLRSKIIF